MPPFIDTSWDNGEGHKEILVYGATGRQGGATIRRLLETEAVKSGRASICAFVRSPRSPAVEHLRSLGVTLRVGSLDDPRSVAAACAHVTAVFLLTTSGGNSKLLPSRTRQCELQRAINVINACVTAKSVELVVYSSFAGADRAKKAANLEYVPPTLLVKAAIEGYLQSSGLPHAILRPALLMDALLEWGPAGLSQGSVPGLTSPDTRTQFITADDVGLVAAQMLTHPRAYRGRAIDLAGDELSGNEIAALIARLRRPHVAARGEKEESWAYDRAPIALFKYLQTELYSTAMWLDANSPIADVKACRQQFPSLCSFEAWATEAGIPSHRFRADRSHLWMVATVALIILLVVASGVAGSQATSAVADLWGALTGRVL